MPIWRKSAFVAEIAAVDEERVAVLNLRAEKPVVLTGSAAIIWSLIDGVRTEADILAKLQDIFVTDDDAAAEMARQLTSFLAQLERQGLADAAA